MKVMDLMPIKPNFSSWPISPSLKILLLNEEKWPDYFSINPIGLAMILSAFNQQITSVNFFDNPPETTLFFRFLRKLAETKPWHKGVLREFSEITAEILDKISVEPRFNSKQENVVIHYLQLLSLMLEPKYRDLFKKPEISLWTNDFQKISQRPFNSLELLSQFRHTLLLSFQSITFIKNYPVLIRTISDLAYSLDKAQIDSNELAAMELFDTLGMLDHTLKVSRVRKVIVNQAMINRSLQDTRKFIYNQFKRYVEKNFLQFIVYKSYLARSYSNSTQLTELCKSKNYRSQCKSDYVRFKDNYRCSIDRLPSFFIDIRNNNCSKVDLDRLCVAMRAVEPFVLWMEKFGFKPNYNASQYRLHLADSEKNFLIDKFLFERDIPSEKFGTMATYFPFENPSQTGPLLGSTYTYTLDPPALKHEYVHHLYALYVQNREIDLTLAEGMAELYSSGICSEKNIYDLRNFVNDTFIFELFKARQYPFYFNALKWVAYLVNEKPDLFKTLVCFLQKKDKRSFYTEMDTFIDNASNVQAFVAWSRQQVNLCNNYLSIFPNGHEPPMIYFNDIKVCLNQTQTLSTEFSFFNSTSALSKRNFLVYSDKDLTGLQETALVSYSSEEFTSQVKKGLPLLLHSLLAGFTSACLDNVSLAHRSNYPLLPAYIQYGLKPFLFAVVSAGLNNVFFDQTVEIEQKIARIFTYFSINYLSVAIGQPLTQKLAEKIHNKILCFLVQMMIWTLLWNPSLFLSENSKLLPTLFLQFVQGFCFKVGEETYQLGKSLYSSSSFWCKKQQHSFVEKTLNTSEEIQLSKITFVQSNR